MKSRFSTHRMNIPSITGNLIPLDNRPRRSLIRGVEPSSLHPSPSRRSKKVVASKTLYCLKIRFLRRNRLTTTQLSSTLFAKKLINGARYQIRMTGRLRQKQHDCSSTGGITSSAVSGHFSVRLRLLRQLFG